MVKVTTTDLNLRKGPGLSYEVIRVLRDGTRVTTTGKTSRGFAEVVNGSSTRLGQHAVPGQRAAPACRR